LAIFLFLFNIYKKIRLLEEKLTKLNENIAINQSLENSKNPELKKIIDNNNTNKK
jgi:hypothetical protein